MSYAETQAINAAAYGPKGEHLHVWGEMERSHFAGTAHRKCTVSGCTWINAYDDDPHWITPDEDDPRVCGGCGVLLKFHPAEADDEDDDG